MKFIDNTRILETVKDVLSSDTQQEFDRALDLTAARIYRQTSSGAVDFGGSEFEPAERQAIKAEKENADDDYGWWNLNEGTYFVEFNENLSLHEGQFAFVQPHDRLIRAGASHASTFTQGTPEQLTVMLTVGEGGIRIKENARISTLFMVEDD